LAEFETVFCKAKCATKRAVALDQPNPFAGASYDISIWGLQKIRRAALYKIYKFCYI